MKVTTDIMPRVKKLLEVNEGNRNDDNKLIANIWYFDLKQLGFDPEHIMDLLRVVAEGKLTNPESIRRCRQKIQEESPLLRGHNYRGRQDNQLKIKEELKR